MVEFQDLLNIGPEESMSTVDPMLLQQVLSWKQGYADSGGPFTFLNTDDEPILAFVEGDGLYATPDDGSSGDVGRVLVDGFHGFVGMIVETDVSPATLEANWATCDGTLGTPDLRNRFVVSVGSSYAEGATGGADTINIGHDHTMAHSHAHAHAGTTLAAPAHTHTAGSYLNGLHTHSGTTLTATSHTHDLSNHTHGPGTLSNTSHGHGAGSYGISTSGTTDQTSDFENFGTSGSGNNLPSDGHRHAFSVSGSVTGSSANGSASLDTGTSAAPSSNGTGTPSSTAITGSTGSTGSDASVTGTSGAASATALTGSIASDSSASSATNTGSSGSASQDVRPKYFALYRVKRIA